MNKENKHIVSSVTESAIDTSSNSWLSDIAQLIKLRLNILVVFSALLAAMIADISGTFSVTQYVLLIAGGFLVTGAASILNQVLEKDYDAVMNRTADRPLPKKRFTQSNAVLLAGVFSLIGITLLALLNSITAFVGTIALLSYAFLYTPLKRVSSYAVHFGAIPGALPVVIGVVAVHGSFTPLAIILFTIQFFWQFSHFWAIAWIAHDDYSKAGFKLLPSRNNEKNKEVGVHAVLYTAVLIPTSLLLFMIPTFNWVSIGLVSIVSILYVIQAYKFYIKLSDKSAKRLMFSSFIYLPIVLTVLYLGQIL